MSEFLVLLGIALIPAVFFTLLFFGIRGTIRLYDVKNCVLVRVHKLGKEFQKVADYNCKKIKRRDSSGFDSYRLRQLWGRKEFKFYEDYAITRESDGKTVLNFVEYGTKIVPCLIAAEVKTNTDKNGKETSEIISYLDKSSFTPEFLDSIVEDSIYQGYEDYSQLGVRRGGNFLFWLLIGIAVIITIGLILWMVIN